MAPDEVRAPRSRFLSQGNAGYVVVCPSSMLISRQISIEQREALKPSSSLTLPLPPSLLRPSTQARRSGTVTSTRAGCLPTSSTAPPSPSASSSSWCVARRLSVQSAHDRAPRLGTMSKKYKCEVVLWAFRGSDFLFCRHLSLAFNNILCLAGSCAGARRR